MMFQRAFQNSLAHIRPRKMKSGPEGTGPLCSHRADISNNAENIQQNEDRNRNSDHPEQDITHVIILARVQWCE